MFGLGFNKGGWHGMMDGWQALRYTSHSCFLSLSLTLSYILVYFFTIFYQYGYMFGLLCVHEERDNFSPFFFFHSLQGSTLPLTNIHPSSCSLHNIIQGHFQIVLVLWKLEVYVPELVLNETRRDWNSFPKLAVPGRD